MTSLWIGLWEWTLKGLFLSKEVNGQLPVGGIIDMVVDYPRV